MLREVDNTVSYPIAFLHRCAYAQSDYPSDDTKPYKKPNLHVTDNVANVYLSVL
jgi:hypothetical protein